MRVYVQWTHATPRDWVVLDVASGPNRRAWERLPSKPQPSGTELIDDAPGWVHSLNVQGVTFSGDDHYAVEPISGGLRVTTWNDDPVDYPVGTRSAKVYEFLSPAPDARFGGQLNTRQTLTVFDERSPSPWEGVEASGGPVVVRPWSEFVPPAASVTRHGIWLPDVLNEQHRAVQSPHGWPEWL